MKQTRFKRRGRKRGPTQLRPERGRIEDPGYVAWIHTKPCLACEPGQQRHKTEAHHQYNLEESGGGKSGEKPDDSRSLPLCERHASRNFPESVHSVGKTFWSDKVLFPEAEIRRLNVEYPGVLVGIGSAHLAAGLTVRLTRRVLGAAP